MKQQIRTEEDARDYMNHFQLLFDLNNARFLKSHPYSPHKLYKTTVDDVDYGERTVYVAPQLDLSEKVDIEDLKQYKLLGNSYQKRYNISYSNTTMESPVLDEFFPSNETAYRDAFIPEMPVPNSAEPIEPMDTPDMFDLTGVEFYDFETNTYHNVAEIKKDNSNIELNTLGQHVIDNFEKYFPDYSYMNSSERLVIARQVESGELTIDCKF